MKLLLSYVLLFPLLALHYTAFIEPYVGYIGSRGDYSFWRLVASTALVAALAFLGHVARHGRVTFFAYNFFFVFAFLPQAVLFAVAGTSPQLVVFYALPLLFLFLSAMRPPQLKLACVNVAPDSALVITAILLIAMLALVFARHGLQVASLAAFLIPGELYAVRGEFLENTDLLVAYSIYWISRVIVPIIIIAGLARKKAVWAVLGVVASIYLFAVTGLRSALAIPFAIIGLFFLIRAFGKSVLAVVLAINFGLVALTFFAYAVDSSLETPSLLSRLLVRRVFFSPAILADFYHAFFSVNEKIFWSGSKLNFLTDYPYDLSPPLLIGQYVASGMSANTGYVMDGFMNAGTVGVLVYSVALVLLVRLFDAIDLPLLYLPVVIVCLYSLMATQMTTALANHGIALFVAMLLFVVGGRGWTQPADARARATA